VKSQFVQACCSAVQLELSLVGLLLMADTTRWQWLQ
jgi:hypothetical protein